MFKPAMLKTVLIYSIALAGFAWALQLIRYQFLVRALGTEEYTAIIAVLFAALGVWMGRRLAGPERRGARFQPNRKAIGYLRISDREYQVLELLARGLTNKEIGEEIFVSPNTVKTHVSNLYEKLEVSRRTQAVGKARELHLIP